MTSERRMNPRQRKEKSMRNLLEAPPRGLNHEGRKEYFTNRKSWFNGLDMHCYLRGW
tara:strand:- start:22 stop:192 length:171 start_codon:yes stop_codon:yes gene_type:complete